MEDLSVYIRKQFLEEWGQEENPLTEADFTLYDKVSRDKRGLKSCSYAIRTTAVRIERYRMLAQKYGCYVPTLQPSEKNLFNSRSRGR